MMLRDQFGDAVENTGARQHAKHGHQLAKVTGLTHPCRAKGDRQQFNHQQSGANFD